MNYILEKEGILIHKFYSKLSELLKEHSMLAIATVVDTKGSAPRDVEAKMIILQDGHTFGTIGGGSLEKLVIDDALEALSTGKGFFKKYDNEYSKDYS